MNLVLKSSVSIAALAVFLASPAFAADVYRSAKDSPNSVLDAPPAGHSINWTGFYVGGQVGYSNSNHDLRSSASVDDGSCVFPESESVMKAEGTGNVPEDCKAAGGTWTSKPIEFASAFINGVNSSGFFGGGTIGADIQRGNFLFGVFGDYNFSQAEATAGATLGVCPDCFSANASIEDGESWVVAARAGYLFGSEKRALLYVLGGYGQADVSYSAGTNDPEDDGFKKDLTFSGLVVGAGGEYAITQNVFLGIEWQHFFGGKETIDSFTDESGLFHAQLTDELDTDKVMMKLKLKLNTGVPGLID